MSQQMEALTRANEYRIKRAHLKRQIKSGEVTLQEMLRDDIPDWLENEPVGRLLESADRIGRQARARLLHKVPCSELRPVGSLTTRERVRLESLLDARAERSTSGKRARPHRTQRQAGRIAA